MDPFAKHMERTSTFEFVLHFVGCDAVIAHQTNYLLKGEKLSVRN